jgi:predicted acetyltransferase
VITVADIEIVHPIDVEEASAWFASMATTFLADPDPQDREQADVRRRRGWSTIRHWGARADGRWVATLGTATHSLSVPGSDGGTELVAADALTMVTVAGTHRRRGLLRRMLSESLDAARQRGDAVAILFAAEWAIYGRFGYAPASFAASYELDPRLRGASLPMVAAGGCTLRQVERSELGKYGPEIFEAARRQRAGNIDREPFWWERTLGLHGLAPTKVRGRIPTFVLHTGAEGPDGYVGWAGNSTMDDGSADVDVIHLCAATPEAYRNLWAYLTNLDLVERIRLTGRPVDEPVRWLLGDGRALRQTRQGDGLWLRLLDVPAALSARRYAVADELTFDVVDDDVGGYAAGRFMLRADPDGAECVSSPGSAVDLRIGQRALASCYLGGVSLRAQLDAGQIEEITPGAIDRADTMFGTAIAPWCATDF